MESVFNNSAPGCVWTSEEKQCSVTELLPDVWELRYGQLGLGEEALCNGSCNLGQQLLRWPSCLFVFLFFTIEVSPAHSASTYPGWGRPNRAAGSWTDWCNSPAVPLWSSRGHCRSSRSVALMRRPVERRQKLKSSNKCTVTNTALHKTKVLCSYPSHACMLCSGLGVFAGRGVRLRLSRRRTWRRLVFTGWRTEEETKHEKPEQI